MSGTLRGQPDIDDDSLPRRPILALNAAFELDDGTPNVPGNESRWSEWVAASKVRNFCCDDPLLDWLDIYGSANGFRRDDERPDYDARTDFRAFVFQQA